jgi:hypothetical protein
MSVLLRLLDPFRLAAAAFFKHDIALRRRKDGVHVVLEARSGRSKVKLSKRDALAEQRERSEREELALMLNQLGELLGELPEARQTMRHLVFVEHALGKKGLRSLHRLPLDVLQRALEQLEGLVTNWSPAGLASLRSKMAVAIIDREHMDPNAEADAYRTAAVFDTMPINAALPEVEVRSDDEALAAAYAALGSYAPGLIEVQAELGSPSAHAVTAPLRRDSEPGVELDIRVLHD